MKKRKWQCFAVFQILSVKRSDICPAAVELKALTCTPMSAPFKLHSNKDVRLCHTHKGEETRPKPHFSHRGWSSLEPISSELAYREGRFFMNCASRRSTLPPLVPTSHLFLSPSADNKQWRPECQAPKSWLCFSWQLHIWWRHIGSLETAVTGVSMSQRSVGC